MAEKPKVSGSAEKELDRVEKQFDEFNKNVQSLTMDRMNEAPIQETAPQVERSQAELAKTKDIYLKPHRSISVRDKFNEDYRKAWEYDKEYVQFEAENIEIIGEDIDIWTKPYAGVSAEWWKVPVNKPVWGPRYLAEQIKRASYHRLKMEQSVITSSTSAGSFYGQMAVDTTVQRLNAKPVTQKRSVFMGARNF